MVSISHGRGRVSSVLRVVERFSGVRCNVSRRNAVLWGSRRWLRSGTADVLHDGRSALFSTGTYVACMFGGRTRRPFSLFSWTYVCTLFGIRTFSVYPDGCALSVDPGVVVAMFSVEPGGCTFSVDHVCNVLRKSGGNNVFCRGSCMLFGRRW